MLFGHTLKQSIGADASTFATRKTRSLGARLQIYRAGWSHFHTLAHAPTRRHLTEPVRDCGFREVQWIDFCAWVLHAGRYVPISFADVRFGSLSAIFWSLVDRFLCT